MYNRLEYTKWAYNVTAEGNVVCECETCETASCTPLLDILYIGRYICKTVNSCAYVTLGKHPSHYARKTPTSV